MTPGRPERAPAWEIHLSTEARDWLIGCTTDQAALARVMSSFSMIFQKLEIAGPRVGEPDIKKLTATDDLWEARVKDPTGAYRILPLRPDRWSKDRRRGIRTQEERAELPEVGHRSRAAQGGRIPSRAGSEWVRPIGIDEVRI